jgi:SAM-dependent methyltransferase
VRYIVREFVQDAAENLPVVSPVVEIGARPAEGQEQEAYLRDFFPGVEYIGCDVQEGPNVDRVEDIHKLSFADDSVGTVVCVEVLEHVHDPLRAVREIHRVLKPGGVAVLTSVMFFPIHSHPWDFWRFTPEGFELVLSPFETSLVFAVGMDVLPEGVFGVGVKGAFDGLTRERFPRTDASCKRWGEGMPVDLGPIRMTLPQLWRFTLKNTLDAVKRRGAPARSRRSR